MKTMRQVQDEQRELARQRAKLRRYTQNGRRMDEGSTGNSVFTCPGCGAPVVQSEDGKRAHAQRMPQCRAILGLPC